MSSITGLLLLAFVWAMTRQLPAPRVWVMVKRLRIFFISLFVMYFWFTPGQLIWPALDTWSPTVEGLMQGAQRISALVLLVFGVESLLRLLSRDQLLTGLYFLASPFQYVGVNRDRFIVRVLLTLQAAELSPPQVKQISKFEIKHIGQYITQISHRIAEQFNAANNCSSEIEEVVFEIKPLPHWIQWLIPLMIAALFLFLDFE